MAGKQRKSIGLREALAVLGLGLLSYGAWLVYKPAAFIAAGAILLGAALYGAVVENRGAGSTDA